jgi:large subunit ribosomal protein L6
MLSYKIIINNNILNNIFIGKNFIQLKSEKGVLCKKKQENLIIVQKYNILYIFKKIDFNKDNFLIIIKRLKKLFNLIKYGYSLKLRFIGIGYKMEINTKQNNIELKIGFALPIIIKIPLMMQIKNSQIQKNSYIFNSIYPNIIKNLAYNIRNFRKPEPYKGKGIRYQGEYVRLKQGKKSNN